MYLEQETQSGTYSAGVENESEQQDWGGGAGGTNRKPQLNTKTYQPVLLGISTLQQIHVRF